MELVVRQTGAVVELVFSMTDSVPIRWLCSSYRVLLCDSSMRCYQFSYSGGKNTRVLCGCAGGYWVNGALHPSSICRANLGFGCGFDAGVGHWQYSDLETSTSDIGPIFCCCWMFSFAFAWWKEKDLRASPLAIVWAKDLALSSPWLDLVSYPLSTILWLVGYVGVRRG